MFMTLLRKEWREKALLVLFLLATLALLVGARFVFPLNKEIRELLIYAVIFVFFPFAGLILGSSGFEGEYRQGAWAYLFSRPVGRGAIWLAKLAALTSLLALLWLGFLVAWQLPAVRDVSGVRRILLGTETSGFPWESAFLSLVLLIVAFSLSPLMKRQFYVFFSALGAGLFAPAAAWIIINAKAGGFLADRDPSKVLPALFICEALVALAFAGSSLIGFVRSDFSQPRKMALGFTLWFVPFLISAFAGTAAWSLTTLAREGRAFFGSQTSQGQVCFITRGGLFVYSAAENRIKRVDGSGEIFEASAAGGKIAYWAYEFKGWGEGVGELWLANADGTGRQRVLGRGPREADLPDDIPVTGLMISPDGARIAVFSSHIFADGARKQSAHLWIVNADGSSLEGLPDQPALFGDQTHRPLVYLAAWARNGTAMIFERTFEGQAWGLWLYDLSSRSARPVLEEARRASWFDSLSPRGDYLVIRRGDPPDKPWTLALLDLETLAVTDIPAAGGAGPGEIVSRVAWDRDQSRMAYVCRTKQAFGPERFVLNVYSLSEKKVLAAQVLTTDLDGAWMSSPAWTPDGSRIIVNDGERRGLRVLGPDLREIEKISLPRGLKTPTDLNIVGDQALVEDRLRHSIYRCDLKTKNWKKLY